MFLRNPIRRYVPLLILLGLVTALIPACGDDSPGDPGQENPPSVLVTVPGAVTLPEGCTTDPSTLQLISAAGKSSAGADGAFVVKLFDGSGQLVLAKTGSGNPFLMGWIGDDTGELSARSTADVLTYLTLGAWMLPCGDQTSVRRLIGELDVELDSLVSAVEAELVAHPDGLTTLSEGIRDALAATVAGLLGVIDQAGEKGVLIEPAGQRSGVEVLNRGGLNSIILKNSYRRRVWVSLDRIGYVDQQDVEHELDEAANIFEIDPVAGFEGVIGTIDSYFTGEIAYTPVETEPIALQNVSGAKRSIYTLVTGGMGLVPPDADDALSTAELEAIEWLALKTTVWDFFVPLVMNLVATAGELELIDGVAGIDLDQIDEFFTVLLYVKDTLPTIYRDAADGNVVDALHDLWGVFTGSDEFQNLTFSLVRSFFEKLGVESGYAAQAVEGAAEFMEVVGWIDIVGGFMDTGIITEQIGRCDVADRWELKVTDPKVTILPLRAVVQSGAEVDTIRVNVDDDTGGGDDGNAYAYHWTCDGQYGDIINPIHPADLDNDFETSSEWVGYQAEVAVAGVDSVHVDVYQTVGGLRTFVGRASSVVQVSLDIDLQLILRGSDSTDFDRTIQDWTVHDTEGVIYTEDVHIYKYINGVEMFPNNMWILGGPDDIALTAIVGYAKLGDSLELKFYGYPSWLGPVWLHYVGEGTHGVAQVTEGMTVPSSTPFVWSATLD